MDGDNYQKPRRTRSLGCSSNAGSAWIHRSVSASGALPLHIHDENEGESVSEAGDIGDRALNGYKLSNSGSNLWTHEENGSENGVTFPVLEYDLLQTYGFWSHDPASNTVSLVSPLPEEIISPLAPKPLTGSDQVDRQVSLRLVVLCLSFRII